MAHDVDGLDVSYTSRTSWKAYVRRNGAIIATAPVTWTKGTWKNKSSNKWYQQVWYQNQTELMAALNSIVPFIVAVAEAHDYNVMPHAFMRFNCLYEVKSTAHQIDALSIETEVLRRVTKATAI